MKECAALIVGNDEYFVGTVFQADDGKFESIGTYHSLHLPVEVRETRHYQNIIDKRPNGKVSGKKIYLLSHYENSILTCMARGMNENSRGRTK